MLNRLRSAGRVRFNAAYLLAMIALALGLLMRHADEHLDPPGSAAPVLEPQAAWRTLLPGDVAGDPGSVRFFEEGARARTIASFRGKVLLVNVWATWCEPCLREMPTLDRLQRRLAGSGLEVLAISIDAQGMQAVQRFYRQAGINALKAYIGSEEAVRSGLRVTAIPTSILFGRDGTEVWRDQGAADWDSGPAHARIQALLQPEAAAKR
jgi:thiol-disulfide isomerase/thioredoxin